MNNANSISAYGLWGLVIINSAIFITFAFNFFKPKSKRDWRTFGTFSAFIVALFIEMYGFPLTIYFLSGWLVKLFPNIDLFSHDAGHFWYTILGFKGDPHFNPIHIASNLIIFGGLILIIAAWCILYEAQKKGKLAMDGPYHYVRHPQYIGFILIMTGFLLQWPTLITLLMFPVLVFMYIRLAHKEEQEVTAEFGDAWTEEFISINDFGLWFYWNIQCYRVL